MRPENRYALSAVANVALVIVFLGTAYGWQQSAAQYDQTCQAVWRDLGGTLNAMSITLQRNDSRSFSSYALAGPGSATDSCERSSADDAFDGNIGLLLDIGQHTDPPPYGQPSLWWDGGGRATLGAGFHEIGVTMFNAASPKPVYARAEQLVADMRSLGYPIP